MDLDIIREIIKNKLKDNLTGICDLTNKLQALNYRICPRNIYQDEKARTICVNPCRKRFATCFKEYFRKEQKQ